MRLSKVTLILTFLISLTLTACVATSTTTTNPTPTPLASSATPSVYFPVQKDIPRVVPAGDIHGTLVLDNGGLRLKPDQGGESELIIWPYGFSLAFDQTRIQIVDGKGVVSGVVGEHLDLGGGGDYSRVYAEDRIGRPLPSDIKGPFWIASEVLPKPVVAETLGDATPPIVRVSDNNYSNLNAVHFMGLIQDVNFKAEGLSQQSCIDGAVAKAYGLNLDGANLETILTKLVFHIDQLDFVGKNIVNGQAATFMLSSKTAQLPYVIEKAKYMGKDVWMMGMKWEINYQGDRLTGSHVALVVFEYGTTTVLLAMSCT